MKTLFSNLTLPNRIPYSTNIWNFSCGIHGLDNCPLPLFTFHSFFTSSLSPAHILLLPIEKLSHYCFMALKSKLPYRVVEKFPEGVNFAAEY